MPKSIYTVLVLTVTLWFFWAREVIHTPPVTTESILRFLLLLFFALSLTLSFPFYYYFYRQSPSFTNLKLIYRRSLKWGFYLGFGATFLFMLRAFNLFHFLNIFLFMVLYISIYLQIKGKR